MNSSHFQLKITENKQVNKEIGNTGYMRVDKVLGVGYFKISFAK